MSSTSVLCIAGSETQAREILSRLRTVGFSGDDISVLFPDRSGTRDFAHELNSKAPEGATTGAGAGGLLGGALGWIVGIGALAVPGLGPLVAAGPIMAALSGAAVGAAAGALSGALIGLGIPEVEARRYEGKVRDGNILLSVHAVTSERVKTVKEIFESAGATDISTSSEQRPPKPDVHVVQPGRAAQR